MGAQGGNYLYDSLRKLIAPRYIKSLISVVILLVSVLLVTQLKTVYDYSVAHHRLPWTTAREKAYVEASDWLKEHTDLHASVAAMEIGTIGYYSGRTVVDLLGLATPAAIPNVRSGDWGKTILDLKPDYVLIQNRIGVTAFDTVGSDKLIFAGRDFANYVPVHRFADEGYDIAIYQHIREAGAGEAP